MLTLLHLRAKYNKSSIATDLDPGVQTKAGSGSGANNFGGKKDSDASFFIKLETAIRPKYPDPDPKL